MMRAGTVKPHAYPPDRHAATRRRRRRATPAFSPLYQQIKALILQSLQAGEWKPGEAIPSEIDLAARFRVSQGTVRKAIDELAADNLVVRRQGKGTFVATHAEQHVQYRFLKLMPDSGDAGSEGPAAADHHRLQARARRADIARSLALRTGDAVLQVRRVLAFAWRARHPRRLWLPGGPSRASPRSGWPATTGPMYALFETEFGVRMVRAEEKIRAVLPDADRPRCCRWRAAPLLSVERLAFTYNDVPMELRRGFYRTDRHHYRNELS